LGGDGFESKSHADSDGPGVFLEGPGLDAKNRSDLRGDERGGKFLVFRHLCSLKTEMCDK
jgi:hypothetical protein